MAIAYVAGATQNVAANPNGSGLQMTLPAGCNVDDVAVILLYSRSNSKTVTNVSGPTQLQYTSTANGGMIWVGYKVLTSTDISTNGYAGTYTFNSVSNGTSGCLVCVFRGVDTSSPVRTSASPVAGGASDTPDPPSVSITSGDTVVAMFGKMDDCGSSGTGGMTAPSTPSSFTLPSDGGWQTTSGTDGSAAMAYLLAYASTSCDPGTFSTNSGGLSTYWYADTIALKPSTSKNGTANVVACAVASAGSTKPGRSSSVAVAVASAASTKPARSSVVACAVASATGGRIKRGTANVFAVASTGGGGADSLTVWSSTADGDVSSYDATYETARSAGTLTATTSASSAILAGQWTNVVNNNGCFESFFSFDTSTVGSGSTVTVATVSLYGSGDTSTTDFTVQVRIFDWGGTLTTGDWRSGNPSDSGSLDEYTLVASHATSSGWPTNAYTSFTSESAFLANIAQAGTTYILTDSDRHLAGNTPTGSEYVSAYFADDNTGGGGTDRDPKLYVEYTSGTAGPTGSRIRQRTADVFATAVATATGSRVRQRTADVFAVALGAAAGTSIGAPATVTVVMSGEDRYVTWDAVVGATGYVVERSVDGGAWTQESP